MSKSTLYLILAVIGAIVPYTVFVPWLLANGLNTHLFLNELLANRVSTFFALDLLLAAIVVIVYIRVRGKEKRIPNLWIPLAATCLIGVSCGLPLFLYLDRRHARTRSKSRT